MMKRPNIKDLVSRIDHENRIEFLAVLRALIENDIAGRSPLECLRIVTTSPNGNTRVWSQEDGPPYFWRLWRFLRNEPYKEDGYTYSIDSVLTAPILEMVSTGITELIVSYQDEVAEVIVTEVMVNEGVRDAFLQVLLKDKLVQAAGTKARSLIISQISPNIQGGVYNLGVHVASGASAIIGKVAATSFGKIILKQMSYQIAHNLGPIIIKLLAKPAVALLLKKFVVAAILASLMKMVAAKLGSAAFTAAILPVIVGWLIIDVAGFPRKLGVGVADALCENLGDTFDKTMEEILGKIVAVFIEEGLIEGLAEQVAKDPTLIGEVNKLLSV